MVNQMIRIPDGCVLWLDLTEDTGDILYDHSGNGNNGRVYGAVLEKRLPFIGRRFDGVDDYAKVLNSPSLNPTEWTIVAWIKHNFVVGQDIGYWPFILSKGRSENKGYWMGIHKLTQGLFVGIGDGTEYAELRTDTLDNDWHMVVGQLKENELIAYVDLNKYSKTLTFTPEVSLRDLIIGAHDYLSYNFNGLIGSLHIYNRALDPEEIKYLNEEFQKRVFRRIDPLNIRMR